METLKNQSEQEPTRESLKKRIEELEEEIKELKENLITDELTGVNTKKYLLEALEKEIKSLFNPEKKERKEGLKNLSVLFLDLDNFKEVNDKFTHLIGDQVLQEIGKILKQQTRAIDVVSRWGGDEFVIALKGADLAESQEIAGRIIKTISNSEKIQKLINRELTVSIGIAKAEPYFSAEETVEAADYSMYESKEKGKGQVKHF